MTGAGEGVIKVWDKLFLLLKLSYPRITIAAQLSQLRVSFLQFRFMLGVFYEFLKALE